jgi:hypothetical protein
MLKVLSVLAAAGALAGAMSLEGCSSVSAFRAGRDVAPAKTEAQAKDCTKGGLGCPPTDRRQYYDQKSDRYYYFDTSTGRYYWENGDPRF